ncbi:MAG: hypothetical protein K2K22_01395 [Muribaculaceae bacterium]|nr:hypothetical protein [Muribaculaceae bacterium]
MTVKVFSSFTSNSRGESVRFSTATGPLLYSTVNPPTEARFEVVSNLIVDILDGFSGKVNVNSFSVAALVSANVSVLPHTVTFKLPVSEPYFVALKETLEGTT